MQSGSCGVWWWSSNSGLPMPIDAPALQRLCEQYDAAQDLKAEPDEHSKMSDKPGSMPWLREQYGSAAWTTLDDAAANDGSSHESEPWSEDEPPLLKLPLVLREAIAARLAPCALQSFASSSVECHSSSREALRVALDRCLLDAEERLASGQSIGNAMLAHETIVLPAGMTKIRKGEFQKHTRLKQVNLPQGLVTIGEEAFADCAALATINFPASLERIGQNAFAACYALDYGAQQAIRNIRMRLLREEMAGAAGSQQ